MCPGCIVAYTVWRRTVVSDLYGDSMNDNMNDKLVTGTCRCGYSTDEKKNCNGTHRVVSAVIADIVASLEAKGFTDAAEQVKTFSKSQ